MRKLLEVTGTVTQSRDFKIGAHTMSEIVIERLLSEGRSRLQRVSVPAKLRTAVGGVAPGEQLTVEGHMQVTGASLVDGELAIGADLIAHTMEVNR